MLDQDGLKAATDALREMLAAEAHEQGAFFRPFPDGRVSVELEWIDPADLVEAVVQSYIENAGSGARQRAPQGERPVPHFTHSGIQPEHGGR